MNLTQLKPLINQMLDSMANEPGDFVALTWMGNAAYDAGHGVPPQEHLGDGDDIFDIPRPRLMAIAVIDGLIWHPFGAIVTFNGAAIVVREKYADLAAVLYPEVPKK